MMKKYLLVFILFVCSTSFANITDDMTINDLEESCYKSDFFSCNMLSTHYYHGTNGADKDLKLAFEFSKYSCENNDPQGCSFFAHWYYYGEVVEQDRDMAFELFKKSCQRGVDTNGFTGGCTSLYKMTENEELP